MRSYGVMVMLFRGEFPGSHSNKENLMSSNNKKKEIYSFLKRHTFSGL